MEHNSSGPLAGQRSRYSLRAHLSEFNLRAKVSRFTLRSANSRTPLSKPSDSQLKNEKPPGQLESGDQVQDYNQKHDVQQSVQDSHCVSWSGDNDPENPKNWPMRKKQAAVFVVSCFSFMSPLSSSMVAPALGSIGRDLNISAGIEQQLLVSIFVLAYVVGPLFLGPLSEVYGRAIILQLSNIFYVIWNIACGVAQTKTQLIVFRFLAGLGGSAALSIGGGVISDLFTADQRGRAMAIFSVAPMLGPAIGPIACGFIAEKTTWRWIFYSTTIADGIVQALGLLLLRETYAPVLLKWKAKKMRKETGNLNLISEFETAGSGIGQVLSTALVRPFRLLGTQPIVQVLSLYMAYAYGLMYLMLTTFPTLWTSPKYYDENIGIGGLNYISLGLGFFLGSQCTAPLVDKIYHKLRMQNNGEGRPEYRVPMMAISAVFNPIGLFIYGWTAQARTHWIAPNIGAFIFAASTIVTFQCIVTYVVDAYQRYAASALSAAVVMRSLAGFGFPLFAPAMFSGLGYGWGGSLLAFIAIAIGIPSPFLLWFYGEKLRKLSPYASD